MRKFNEKVFLYINYWLDIFSRYDIVNPNITSNVEFHNRYKIIIIPLLEQDQIIIIIDIIKKKLSKHKKNFSKRFRFRIIPITLPNVKINIIQ